LPGAQIACFFYPFIDPANKPLEEIRRDDELPYGGCVIPLTGDGTRFQILTTPGNNETLYQYEQAGKPVETYEIEVDPQNPQKIRILHKEVVQKDMMHYTSEEGINAFVPVPLSHQLQQVMWDSDIIKVAESATLLMRRCGPQRVEFSSDGEKVFLNESVDIGREEVGAEREFRQQGEIFIVASVADVQKLAQLSDEVLSRTVVYAADRQRGSPTNATLARTFAEKEKKLVILFAGTARTAHAMKVFSDMGHFAFPVGQQDLREGDEVVVKTREGEVSLENLSLRQLKEAIPLDGAYKIGVSRTGGKAERISFLKMKGFNVPPGVVLTTDFFDGVLNGFKADRLLASIVADPTERNGKIGDLMRQAIPQLPDKIWDKVVPLLRRFDLLSPEKKVIVRSSANVEDLRNQSFAGVFESIAHRRGEAEIQRAVLECIYAAFAPPVVHYLGPENLDRLLEIKLALIIQEMVKARISGTVFGGDPQTKNTRVVLIEVKRGLGMEIVEGTGVEERLVLTKSKGDFKVREGQRLLSEPEETLLFHLAGRLEEEFGYPQDVEWSIDFNNKLWILQSRDL